MFSISILEKRADGYKTLYTSEKNSIPRNQHEDYQLKSLLKVFKEKELGVKCSQNESQS